MEADYADEVMIRTLAALTLALALAPLTLRADVCKGADPCKACQDCSACAYCSPKNSKGVCRAQDAKQQQQRDKKRAKK